MGPNGTRKLKAKCDHCERSIRFVEAMAGQPTICPNCRKEVVLPTDFRKIEFDDSPAAPPASSPQRSGSGARDSQTVYTINEENAGPAGHSPSYGRTARPTYPGPGHPRSAGYGQQLMSQTQQMGHQQASHQHFGNQNSGTRYVSGLPTHRYAGPYTCPYCNTYMQPFVRNRVSTAGWVTLAILLIVFFPLFWIGFLITEPVRSCSCCGRELGLG